MSRTILFGVIIAALGAGIYYFLSQPEPTPAEQLQSAAQDAGDAVSDAAEAATEQASEAASSVAEQAADVAEQAGQAATDLADQASDAAEQAGEEVAALANQGQELITSWIEDGALTMQNFDYDAMVASVQESGLAQDVKTQVIQILDDIKASPETIATKIQELRDLLAGQ